MKITLLLVFVIGFIAGLRALTPPAMVAWATYFGWLNLSRPLALIGSLPAVIILSVLAAGEIIFDKLPTTPKRTETAGLLGRVVTGGLAGACLSMAAGQRALVGLGLGMIGGLAGSFAGYFARTRIVQSSGLPDYYVAIVEDLIAIAGSLLIVSHI